MKHNPGTVHGLVNSQNTDPVTRSKWKCKAPYVHPSVKIYFVNLCCVSPLTLSQCTLAGPVYTGMPLECHWLTQCTLAYHWVTQRILAGYTGTPLGKLSWNSPTLECHWRNLVENTHTGIPLEKLWLLQPTLEPHWRDCNSSHTPRHIELSRVASKPIWNDKMAGHKSASAQVSVNATFTWSLLICNGYQFCS